MSPHPNLLPITSEKDRHNTLSIGPEHYVLSRFLPDPQLFTTQEVEFPRKEVVRDEECPVPPMKSGQRHQKRRNHPHTVQDVESKLKAMYRGLREEIKSGRQQDCGLIVEFPNSGILMDWNQLDNSPGGKPNLDFHVKVTNTSPVEMVLVAGQPIAEAVTAMYEDSQRNIAQLVKTPLMTKEVSKSFKCVGDTSNVDVDALTLLLTQKPGRNHPMQLQLDAQIPHGKDDRPIWPSLTDSKVILSSADAVVKLDTACAAVRIKRAVLTEHLMTLIHCTAEHQIESLGDDLDEKIYGRSHPVRWSEVTKRFSTLRPDNPGELGKLRFVLGIHKLLYRFTGLTVSVFADMLNRPDTREHLIKMLQSCAEPSVLNPISEETRMCNFENLLIMERWVEDPKRAIRATPVDDKVLLQKKKIPSMVAAK